MKSTLPRSGVRTLELFCCSGGFAAGFRGAGVEFDLAIDHDPDACEAYSHNLGRRPLRIDAADFLRLVEAAPAGFQQLELVVADPPCVARSRAGCRRGLEDARDALELTAALLEQLEPRLWLVGNVPGLDDAPNQRAQHATLGRLQHRYCIDYASLDAAAYGVPQHRVRPFWFGHPHGTECIQWPAPTHGATERQLQVPGTELLPYVTVRQALAHLQDADLGQVVVLRQRRTRRRILQVGSIIQRENHHRLRASRRERRRLRGVRWPTHALEASDQPRRCTELRHYDEGRWARSTRRMRSRMAMGTAKYDRA